MEDICKKVYAGLGTGFRETIYQEALAVELRSAGHIISTECVIPVKYKDQYVGNIRCDIIMNNDMVIECKAIAKLGEKERQQIKQYLRTTGIFKGYLVNFGNTLEVEYFN